MKTKINKWDYLWIIQGRYSRSWEDVFTADNYKQARSILWDYKNNDIAYAHRLIRRRELNPLYTANCINQILGREG
jgi:hypothetical protein